MKVVGSFVDTVRVGDDFHFGFAFNRLLVCLMTYFKTMTNCLKNIALKV